ncbi:MAG TPA: sugar kinase [Spirochaetes bacterium]|nr:sugar kinase [Spirochaetota bacterium]
MSGNQVEVACIGILVADFFSSPIPNIPKPGELMLVESISLSTGGCAANTAVALTKLGLKAGVVGKVGSDPFGNIVINDLSKKEIDTSGITKSPKEETSKTIIIPTRNEDRRYLHLFGANKDFRKKDISLAYLAGVKCIYVGGFLGLPEFDGDSLASIFKFAKKRKILTVLDVIVPGPGDYLKQLRKTLPYVDAFIPNDDESAIITGEKDPEKQADIFLGLGADTVMITMGLSGALLKTKNLLIKSGCYDVDFVDASGAGDAFDAGFMAAILHGESLLNALKTASAMGASCVTKLGCSEGLFSKNELEIYIKNNELKIEEHILG